VSPRKPQRSRRDRWVKRAGLLVLAGVIAAANLPLDISYAKQTLHHLELDSQAYKSDNGHWSILNVPTRFRINAVHAALLYTGKVLIIAGSGNDRGNFDAGRFESLLWDPQTDNFKLIKTPVDMFCGGHAFLPDGKLLIAGGTHRYELLGNNVKRAAGRLTVKYTGLGSPVTLPRGTRFVSTLGVAFRTAQDVTLPPATETTGAGGQVVVTPSAVDVFVEAVDAGKQSIVNDREIYTAPDVSSTLQHHVSGEARGLNLAPQNFQGIDASYLFDPATEQYEKVANLTIARWYPSLVSLAGGRVLAVSGLDGFGHIIEGQNELYDPATKKWTAAPQLTRRFPTYPSLFLMSNDRLFFSGSATGYGPDDIGRTPGIWNLSDNTFQAAGGLRDANKRITSGSVLLPPAQTQRVLIVGGGKAGDSNESTKRTDVIDLTRTDPRYTPGPDLSTPTRYPSLVITPDDRVLVTGGSEGYRGAPTKDRPVNSDLPYCHFYDPQTNTLSRVADSTVGRDYHSEALLLPDGRVVTLGGNPLYGKNGNGKPSFEQRIEIYSPPYLYHGDRPVLGDGPQHIERGTSVIYSTPDAADIESARLMRPSAVTHVTDLQQRSIALGVIHRANAVELSIPDPPGLVPSGWYMLFVTNSQHTPSLARWVHVM
jgi:hypothetical protein